MSNLIGKFEPESNLILAEPKPEPEPCDLACTYPYTYLNCPDRVLLPSNSRLLPVVQIWLPAAYVLPKSAVEQCTCYPEGSLP